MIRAAAIVLAVLAVSRPAHAAERTWIGFSLAAQTISPRMLGEAREIVDGLGLTRDDGSGRWFVPRANISLDYDREGKLGLDLSLGWARDFTAATSTTPIQYRVRRDLFPLTALVRFAPGKEQARLLLAAGGVVGLSRFDESGWLGDGVRYNPLVGAQFRLGGRGRIGDELQISYGLYVQWLYLSRENPLLGDGGGAPMGGLDLQIEFGL